MLPLNVKVRVTARSVSIAGKHRSERSVWEREESFEYSLENAGMSDGSFAD